MAAPMYDQARIAATLPPRIREPHLRAVDDPGPTTVTWSSVQPIVNVGAAVRRMLWRVTAIMLLVTVALSLFFAARAQAGVTERATVSHVVATGETLWDIAALQTPADGDIRATVTDIKRLNDLDTSLIRSGQTLLVPARD